MKLLYLAVILCVNGFLFSQSLINIRTPYLDGIKALTENKLSLAESNFIYAINIQDNSPETLEFKSRSYYFLGDVYFIKQDYNQSIRSYQTVVQKFYRQEIYSKAMYKLGRTLVIAGRYKDGMALLSDYISQYSNKDYLADSSLYWTARGYIGAGDFQTALKTFNFILEKYPSTGLSYEIRSSINKLTKYLETQNSQSSQTNNLLTPDSGKLSNAAAIRQQTGQLEDEKVMLEKISRILQIKQRLLDIKAEKVEILSRLRQQNESKQ